MATERQAAPNNVAHLRRGAGMSQAELARLCGVNAHTISALEKGRYEPKAATVQAVAQALLVDPLALWNDPFNQARLRYKEEQGMVGVGGALLAPAAINEPAMDEPLAGEIIDTPDDPEIARLSEADLLARLPAVHTADGAKNILRIIAAWIEREAQRDESRDWEVLAHLEREYVRSRVAPDRQGRVADMLRTFREDNQREAEAHAAEQAGKHAQN